jgi:hypothetical protein
LMENVKLRTLVFVLLTFAALINIGCGSDKDKGLHRDSGRPKSGEKSS